MIGPESPGKLQAVIGQVDGDDISRSTHAGSHQEAHTQRAHTKNRDGIVEQEGFTGEGRHLLRPIKSHRHSHYFSENRNFGRQVVRNANQKALRYDVHVLRPAAKQIWWIGGTQVIAIVRHVLAEVVREVVPAVITVTAGNDRADDPSVTAR